MRCCSFAVGYEYVRRHFDDAAKQSAVALVRDLRASFAADMAAVAWMDADTRDAALHKARAMTEFIGYPEWYANASALDLHYRGVSLAAASQVFYSVRGVLAARFVFWPLLQVAVGSSHFRNTLGMRSYLMRQAVIKLRKPVDRLE